MKVMNGKVALAALLVASTAGAQETKAPAPSAQQVRKDAAKDAVKLPKATVLELKNGARLRLVEKHEVPLVSFSAKVRGGALGDPEGKEANRLVPTYRASELIVRAGQHRACPES